MAQNYPTYLQFTIWTYMSNVVFFSLNPFLNFYFVNLSRGVIHLARLSGSLVQKKEVQIHRLKKQKSSEINDQLCILQRWLRNKFIFAGMRTLALEIVAS